jgi:hypothetical protein
MFSLHLNNGTVVPLTSAEREDFIGIFQSISQIAQTADSMTAENLSSVTLTDESGKEQEITGIVLQGFQAVQNPDGTYTGHFYYRGVYEEDKLAKAGKILLGGADATRAQTLRTAIVSMTDALDDETAIAKAQEVPELFDTWSGQDVFYESGKRLIYNGTLYKVLQAHSSQPDWTPEAAPSLFARVLAGQDGTEIGVWEQPDSTNPYMTGDKAHYPTINDPIYESTIDNNVWSPDTYPQGWKLAE